MMTACKRWISGFLAGWLLISATALLFPLSASAQASEYTEIRTKAELAAVRDDLDGRYRLMADIEFTAQDFSESGDYYQFGRLWRPLGYDADHAFTGEFDGNGFSVRGLRVNVNGGYAGLFGYSTGSIYDLTVADCAIKASGYNYDMVYAGGIVGDGTATNCYYLALADYDNRSGIACNNATMKQKATYKGFDFTGVWTMGGSNAYPYPQLRAVPMTATFNGPTVGHTSSGSTTTTEADLPTTHTTPATTSTGTTETPDSSGDSVPWWALIPMGVALLVVVLIIILLLRKR